MSGPLNKLEDQPNPAFITYELRNVRKSVGYGATEPEFGEVSAIVKQDCTESRAQIYSEYVASRLAGLLGIPVATGVFVAHSRGLRYASLKVSEVGFSLTEVDYNEADEVAERYPVECAKIAVFDVWIGNLDRAGNLRANMEESTDNVIVGLDHGGCLLSCADDQETALLRLQGMDWPRNHIFSERIFGYYANAAIDRIQQLGDDAIQEACMLGGTVGSVMLPDQAMIAEVLIQRKNVLSDLVGRLLHPR